MARSGEVPGCAHSPGSQSKRGGGSYFWRRSCVYTVHLDCTLSITVSLASGPRYAAVVGLLWAHASCSYAAEGRRGAHPE